MDGSESTADGMQPTPRPSNGARGRLAARAARIAPFRVVEILERARELERTRRIVHFEVGEPDFPTAPSVVEAGVRTLREGRTGYTQPLGLPELREAIAARAGGIDPARVAVTTGASAGLNLLAQTLVDPGAEVLMTDPGYPCNAVFVEAAGGFARRVPVDARTRFQMTAQAVRAGWNERTAGVLLASPANPTGSLIGRKELEAISAFAATRGFVVVDEIYSELTYGRIPPDRLTGTALAVDDGFFVVNSFSKYFGMTGWRVGWLVVPEWAAPAIGRAAQNLYIAPPTPSQYAALAALHEPALGVHEERRAIFERRRRVLLDGLADLGLPAAHEPEGAFYVYVDIGALGVDAQTLCHDLIENHGVATTPGTDFGAHRAERHIRLAYTVDEADIRLGLERIGLALQRL